MQPVAACCNLWHGPVTWHRRPGSHVPYKSQIELRAAYMPDAAWAVSVHPPSLSRKMGQPPVLTSSNPLWHIRRAVTSDAPPGGNPTMMRTGRDG
jgi:hypothetical protein